MTDGRGAEPVQDPERHKPGSCTRLQLGVAIVAVLLLRLAVRACVGRPICSQEGSRGGHSRLMPGMSILTTGEIEWIDLAER